MKRKDFLTKMRNRRRGDEVQLREPEQRRAIDWRTLRVDLPAEGSGEQATSVGSLALLPGGVRLTASVRCWVRGYRFWAEDDGRFRAEFQYRPVPDDDPAPPGAEALEIGATWAPAA